MALNPAEKLLTVTPAMNDRQVAMMIADKLIFYTKSDVYRYLINHSVRPPRCAPCPVEYEWIVKDKVGASFVTKTVARKWLTDALLHGYQVEEADGHRKPTSTRTESIDIVRKRAEYHQRPKVTYDEADDIPF